LHQLEKGRIPVSSVLRVFSMSGFGLFACYEGRP
jgi:hypothetical protein